jgi:SPP1 family predicted phage head-tail adaptor
LTGREFFAAAQHVQNIDTKITIRYLPNQSVTASDRVAVDGPQGGVYDIQAPLVPEYIGEAIVIYARRVNQGMDTPYPTPDAVPVL